MISWALEAAWNYVFGWAGVDMLVGFAAVAIAVLMPKQLDFVTDLRKWAICVALVAFTLMGAIAYGYNKGIAITKAEWERSLVRETKQGEQAHDDAVRDLGPIPTDRGVFRGDPFNRDRGKQPSVK